VKNDAAHVARYKINWPLVGVITVVLAVLSILGSSRLVIETDILDPFRIGTP
jgi:hypothetical protein